MKLFNYQQDAINAVLADIAKGSMRGCVVMPTGTGKTWVSLNVANHYRKVLFAAPTNYILNQTRELADKIVNPGVQITYVTYPYLNSKRCRTPKLCGFDLIIQDEFHRLGAPVWGKKMQEIVLQNPEAYVLGTTATDFRWLDNCRDMTNELYGGNKLYNMTYFEAIHKNIFPAPHYITGYTELDVKVQELMEKLSRTKEENQEIADLKKAIVNMAESCGIGTILKKHLPKETKKLIVFNNAIKQFDVLTTNLTQWFSEAGFNNLKIYRADSSLEKEEIENNIKEFSRSDDNFDGVKIIVSVNMLNEGIHVESADGCILLRHTLSKNIFLQQIGRPLRAGMINEPLIFDLVDNLDEDGFYGVFANLNDSNNGLDLGRDPGLSGVKIFDNLVKLRDLEEKTNNVYLMTIDRFDEYESLVKKKNSLPSHRIKEEASLYYWGQRHRDELRVRKLYLKYGRSFDAMFIRATKFIKKFGMPKRSAKTKEEKLYIIGSFIIKIMRK